jgi:hypothetical protein
VVCLIRSILILQLADLKLQPRNSTLAAVRPMLKGLRVLEEFWRMADFDHLHTKSCAFQAEAFLSGIISEQRLIRLLSCGKRCSGSLASLSAPYPTTTARTDPQWCKGVQHRAVIMAHTVFPSSRSPN